MNQAQNASTNVIAHQHKKASIVHVLTDSKIGCATFELSNCISALKDDFDFTVILPIGSPSARFLSHAKTVFAPISSGRSFSPKDCLTLRSLLSELSPAILHTHASLSARVAGRSLGIPNILSTRHLVSGSPMIRRPFAPSLYRMTTDLTVATSASATYSLLLDGTDASSLVTLPGGVPMLPKTTSSKKAILREKLSIPSEAKVIGCSVFSGFEGGEETILRAFSLLHENVNYYLLFVGNSPSFVNLALLSAVLGISKNVGFCPLNGPVDTPVGSSVRSLFDVEIFPSSLVGLSPILIPEAMSIGTPVIASSTSRHTDFIRHGATGYLFRKGDAVGLADLLMRMQTNPEDFARVGKEGRRLWQKQFSLSVMALRYRRLYDYLLSTESAGRSPLALRYLFLPET